MALITVLVKCHESGKRKRSRFEADDEQQEVTSRNHEVHTEKGDEQQLVELAATHTHELGVGPLD